MMKTVDGKVAAITGAGSGIGRATSLLFAQKGAHLALSDVDEAGLAQTVAACQALGAQVRGTKVDVAQREAVHAWAEQTVRDFGAAHVVINNAGVALGATIEDTSYEDLEWLLGINFWGVVHGTKAFLPHLRRAGEGHIVNISSLFGLIAVPTQGAYNAAKFAVKGFTDALRQELCAEDCGIGVTCVHPGGIKTNIARAARTIHRHGWVNDTSSTEFERLFSTTAERAAQDIYGAVLKNRGRLLIGNDARILDFLQRLFPSSLQALVVAGARRRRQKMIADGDGKGGGAGALT